MKTLPKARTSEIVEQELGKELLIYDLTTDKAYCLNETSAKIFNACDGKTMFDDLKRRYNFTDDLIHLALAELERNNLLKDYKSDYFAGLSRREIIKRVGLASLIVLPLIIGSAAPLAVHAASGGAANGVACMQTTQTGSTECRSGRCTYTSVSIYNPTNGSTFSRGSNITQCCVAAGIGNIGTGSYGMPTTGNCEFSTICCTGTGTEYIDSVHNKRVCTCDAIS